MGLVGYYRRFIPNVAARSKPLTDLLKKSKTFVWGKDQEAAFLDLCNCLCGDPILQCPDFTKPFILTTDASNIAIGAVLSQGKIGEDLPIAFASRTLNQAEVHYAATEKECLAVVFFTKYFRHYLYGRKFTVVTDHQALIWLHNTRDTSSRLLRWRLRLLDFQYDIQYRPGKTNLNADALSRNPVDRITCAKALPIVGEPKRKRGRPRKVTTSPAPKTHAVIPDLSDNLGIADRVKKRRRPADVPPTYSYSSDDEIDHCDLVKKKTRKRTFKKRLVRFPDGSDYLPPESEVSLKPTYSDESCISTGEAPGF